MAYTRYAAVNFGSGKAGLASTVGYQLYNTDGTPNGARIGGTALDLLAGSYGAVITFPDNFVGSLRWDTGEVTPVYASVAVNPADNEIEMRTLVLVGTIAHTGIGSVFVNHNYPTPGALLYETSEGAGIDNASVRAYLQTDWDAGNRGNAFVVATARTTVGGAWDQAMMLDPAAYVIVFDKQGQFSPSIVRLAVV